VAISPPSDLVLDVVAAADLTDVQAAREKLRSSSAAAEATLLASNNAGFAATVGNIENDVARAKAHKSEATEGNGKVPETYRKFEASILSTFIQNMMPSDSEAVYGKGSAGDFWKGMMAEQIADAVSKRGGIGIAEQVYAQSVDRANGRVPNATPDQDDRNMAMNMVTELQRQTFSELDTDKNKA
jgi:flagellar protein FlgJ